MTSCRADARNESRFKRKAEAVYAALAETKEHPSADTLYRKLKEEYPRISLTTVYTNLAKLRQEGNAVCVCVVDGQERYDANVEPHPHLVCDKCGAVVDLTGMAYLEELDRCAEADNGVKIRNHELVFRGDCKKCKDNINYINMEGQI